MARYIDFDVTMQKNPVTNDIALKMDANAVKQAVKNLVFLAQFDKPRNPNIAGNIRNLLFELATPITAINIKQAVTDVITQYEPRVDLNEITVSTTSDGHGYNITIDFTVLNDTTPQTLSILLERLR